MDSIDDLVRALKAHDIHLVSKQIIKTNASETLKAEETRTKPKWLVQKKGKTKIFKVDTKSNSDEASVESTDNEISFMSRKFR